MKALWSTLVMALFFLLIHSAYAGNFGTLNFGTYNVRNFGTVEFKADVTTNKFLLKTLILKTSADVLAVQEIVDDELFKNFIKESLPQYNLILSECGGSGNQKVGILYNKEKLKLNWSKEDNRIANGESCQAGIRPAMIAQFQMKDSHLNFQVIAVHLKAGGRASNIEARFKQLEILSLMVEELRAKKMDYIAIMGDFNTTEYLEDANAAARFKKVVRDNDLIDFAEEIDCSSYWKGPENDEVMRYASLLDHVMISKEFHQQFKYDSARTLAHCQKNSCRQETVDGLGLTYNEVSDHCPVVAKLR